MPDREKVIKGLEILLNGCEYIHCDDCCFFISAKPIRCGLREKQIQEDAISLLKEQEWHLLTEDADGFIHGLPGDDGQYLMTDGKEIWIDDYVDGVDDGVWLDSGRDVREIKAWMYMPDLPKQEGR